LDLFLEEILLLCLFCILVVGSFWARRSIKQLKMHLALYEAVCATAEDAWAAWDIRNHFLGCSTRFRTLLGCHATGDISITEVLESFGNVSALQDGLAALRFTEGTFSLDLKTQRTNLPVNIHGTHVSMPYTHILCLWVRDRTLDTQEELQLQEAIKNAEKEHAYLLDFLDVLPLPIWHRRPGDLRLDYCNKTYVNTVGTSLERILLEDISLIPGTLSGQGKTLASQALKKKDIQHAAQNTVINGKRCHVILHEIPFQDGTIGFSFDVTERYTTTQKLERYVAAYAEVLGFLSTAIAIFDVDMRLDYFNNAYMHLMGLDEKWLHTSPSFADILEELRLKRKLPEVIDFYAYKQEQLSLFQMVVDPRQDLMHLPNGKTLRVAVAPHPLGGLLFFYEDITDALTMERQYNTLINVQQETIDQLYEGVSVFSSDNRLKFSNPACAEIWGMTPEDRVPGCHISDFIECIKSYLDYGDDWESFKENTISNLTDRISKTGQLLRKGNVIVNFSYIPLSDGTHLHTFVNVTDTCRSGKMLLGHNNLQKT
jgi:PAS domain-containing protein